MNDPHIDVLSGHRALSCSSEQDGERQSSTLGTAPRIRIEPRPNPNARVGKVTLRQRIRRAITIRELRRLIRDAPTATITQRSVDDCRAERASGPLTARCDARR